MAGCDLRVRNSNEEKMNQEIRKRDSDRMDRIYKIEIRIPSLPAFLIDFSESVDPGVARRFLLYSQRID
jgi:hypothetical protein